MDDDLRDRLANQTVELQKRALELSQSDQDRDMATVMQTLALITEALMQSAGLKIAGQP